MSQGLSVCPLLHGHTGLNQCYFISLSYCTLFNYTKLQNCWTIAHFLYFEMYKSLFYSYSIWYLLINVLLMTKVWPSTHLPLLTITQRNFVKNVLTCVHGETSYKVFAMALNFRDLWLLEWLTWEAREGLYECSTKFFLLYKCQDEGSHDHGCAECRPVPQPCHSCVSSLGIFLRTIKPEVCHTVIKGFWCVLWFPSSLTFQQFPTTSQNPCKPVIVAVLLLHTQPQQCHREVCRTVTLWCGSGGCWGGQPVVHRSQAGSASSSSELAVRSSSLVLEDPLDSQGFRE
jgi:hypothetical protein